MQTGKESDERRLCEFVGQFVERDAVPFYSLWFPSCRRDLSDPTETTSIVQMHSPNGILSPVLTNLLALIRKPFQK
jgi:hypothetical protein